MPEPSQRNLSQRDINFQFRNFAATISDTLCIPIINIATILNTFSEANDTLLDDTELRQLTSALAILSRSGLEFITRHNRDRDINNNRNQ